MEKRTRVSFTPKVIQLNEIEVIIQRKSIWEDYENLDKLFIRCSEGEENLIFKLFPKASLLKNCSFEEILINNVGERTQNIGFVPWRRGKYKELVKIMTDYSVEPLKINFYHLNKNDYKELYEFQSL